VSADFADAKLAIVQHYLDIGRYDNAKEAMQRVLESDPEDSYYHLIMATIETNLDNLDLAESECLESMAIGEHDEECYHLLGIINIERKNYIEAEKNILESLRLNPGNPKVVARYGYLMLLTGHDKKAEQLIMEALRLDPNDANVLEISFQYYLIKNKKEQQLNFLGKYIQYSDDEIGKLTKVGVIDLLQNDNKAARENFIQAYLLDPTNQELLSVIEEIDRDSHPIFIPQRLMGKIGGPVVMWISMIVSVMILEQLGLVKLATVILILYIIFCVYTWLTPFIYKHFIKR